jgi:hypothetical protein
MAPFKTQIAKQKSKYKNAAKSVLGCPDFIMVLIDAIGVVPLAKAISPAGVGVSGE